MGSVRKHGCVQALGVFFVVQEPVVVGSFRPHLDHRVVSSIRSRTMVLDIACDMISYPSYGKVRAVGIHRDLQRVGGICDYDP